jgi:hypothetical protein
MSNKTETTGKPTKRILLCFECKWWDGYEDIAGCTNPTAIGASTYVDRVSGEVRSRNRYSELCSEQRTNMYPGDMCGREGKHWEPRPQKPPFHKSRAAKRIMVFLTGMALTAAWIIASKIQWHQ